VANLKTEMRSAQAAYHQAQHSYSAGVATNLDVITAQDLALSAQLAYQQARYNERVRMLNLLRQTGNMGYPTKAGMALITSYSKHLNSGASLSPKHHEF